MFITGYSNHDPEPANCNDSGLRIDASGQNPSSCGAIDGSITVIGIGGNEPYKFSLNPVAFKNESIFNNLGSGNYNVRVKDKNGCEISAEVSLQIPAADPLTATTTNFADTECVNNNGSIQVKASGGTSPYQYKVGTGFFGVEEIFSELGPGNYSIAVKDATDCIFIRSATIFKGDSQTSLPND